MKNIYEKDKYLFVAVWGMAISSFVAAILLLGFVWSGTGHIPPSSIPSFDINAIQSIKEKLSSRQDVDTKGKPDINKVNFGNDEPF